MILLQFRVYSHGWASSCLNGQTVVLYYSCCRALNRSTSSLFLFILVIVLMCIFIYVKLLIDIFIFVPCHGFRKIIVNLFLYLVIIVYHLLFPLLKFWMTYLKFTVYFAGLDKSSLQESQKFVVYFKRTNLMQLVHSLGSINEFLIHSVGCFVGKIVLAFIN